jgi:hypothetical protein
VIRIRWSICWLALGCIAFVGCKSANSASEGGAGTDSGAYDTGGPYEEPPPQPGTCRALCCSDQDCFPDETCTPFNSAWGTLGVCLSSGGTPDGGLMPDGGGTDFGPSCWSLNAPECNPFTNSQCDAGAACDLASDLDAGDVPGVECGNGENDIGPGGMCDTENGPFCIPGYHCVVNH